MREADSCAGAALVTSSTKEGASGLGERSCRPGPVREGVRADAAALRQLQVRQVLAITQRQPALDLGASVHGQ